MTITEYMDAVIALFKSGKATENQWREMANAVLRMSESEHGEEVGCIDDVIVREEAKP